MEEIIYANYIIVGFVNWRETGDCFLDALPEFQGSIVLQFPRHRFSFQLFVFNFIKISVAVRHAAKYHWGDGIRVSKK